LLKEEKVLTIEQVTSKEYENQFQPITNFQTLDSDGVYWGRLLQN